MTWRAKTYRDRAVELGAPVKNGHVEWSKIDHDLESVPLEFHVNGNLVKTARLRCPTCGSLRRSFAIIDTSSISLGEKWACDGCWTGWIRKKKISKLQLARDLGAPQGLLSKKAKAWK